MPDGYPHLSIEKSWRFPNDPSKTRYYARLGGKRVRIRAKWDTTDFARAYTAAMDALENPDGGKGKVTRRNASPSTLGWLALQYFASPRFRKLAKRSQATRRLLIEECLREPPAPGSPHKLADTPIGRINSAMVAMLMDRKADLPGAANNRKKYMSALFGWAVNQKPPLMKANPARDVERVDYSSGGFIPWTVADVAQFEAAHPIGTKARLALALFFHTGARLGDVVTFGRQHVRGGVLRYVPRKTLYKRRTTVATPIPADLASIIAASPCGELTFLVNDYGHAFTDKGFGARFRKWSDAAGLARGMMPHGLRKLRATIAAENRATEKQLMAMFGWSSSAEATLYTESANQARLAAEGARLVSLSDGMSHNGKNDDISKP